MSTMKFEFFPNEILLQCFQYLNIIHIFHSFDQLNHRFNSLIRTISFHLNFQNIQNKFQCEEFCQKLSTDETIRNQLYSLHLSNGNTFYPVHLFISKFPLLQFVHLRSLTLYKLTKNNSKSIRKILSSIPELCSFRMIDCCPFSDDLIFVLPISKLQTLIIPQKLLSRSISDIQFSTIMHLSIDECDLVDLFILLNNALKLNYFKTDSVFHRKRKNTIPDDSRCIKSPANNLKTLHINYFENTVSYFFILLKRTPNLENLIILRINDPHFINAYEWQKFITSSLPHLKNFKFQFNVNHFSQSYDTEQINPQKLAEKTQFYFPKVDTLSLADEYLEYEDYVKMSSLQLEYLQTMVNLSNIKHLILVDVPRSITKDKCKKMLEFTAQLSSICLNCLDLMCWLEDDELCKSLNKIIKKLDIHGGLFDMSDQLKLKRLCTVFTNLEQLTCFGDTSVIVFLIKHLSKLIYIEIHRCLKSHEISWIEENTRNLELDITVDFDDDNLLKNTFIWINRN
ncbi:hypothetical protein I4U23_022556 [Adineta vaga]|nr:hypothetical protein I4U23_022556 [Adineta vaga]